MKIEMIAKVCHEANRALCVAFGDTSQLPWESAPGWQQLSAIEGVTTIEVNSSITPEELHERWIEAKRADGWGYGLVKDAAEKTHPCLVPYAELPAEQRAKDHVFNAIARTLLAGESPDRPAQPEV